MDKLDQQLHQIVSKRKVKHKGCTAAVCTTYTGCMGYCFCVEMRTGKPFWILSTFFYMFQDVRG